MHLAALRSLVASHVPGLAAPNSDEALHRRRRADLGPVSREFYDDGRKLLSTLCDQTIARVRSSPDLLRDLPLNARPGGRPAPCPDHHDGKAMHIVPLPPGAAKQARTVAAGDRYVLPVHAGVPDPETLHDLLKHCDVARMLGRQVIVQEPRSHASKSYQPDALPALISVASAVRDAVRDGGPDLPWDDTEIVRQACQRVPVDLVAQLRAEDLAGLLALTWHCKVRYLSPTLVATTVRWPGPSSPDDGRAQVHSRPFTGTRSSPPR